MTSTYQQQLSLYMIVYIKLSLTIKNVNAFEYAHPRINQNILIGPHSIYAYPGETIQFPCIVSKQFDATVTWCWNDFCTLGKAQLVRHEATHDGLISIYQYAAYPKFRLSINERLNHYNLSITDVSDKDEGIFQCQIQRTMRAHEARSERVHLTVVAPPMGQPKLLLPVMPLKQGQSTNITCVSSPSKPASELILYKNEEIIKSELSSAKYVYEFDKDTNKNVTKLIYTIDDPDSSWHNAIVKCKQIYEFANNPQLYVIAKLNVYYKPRARIESQNRSPLNINSTATFRCIVHGNPEPQLKWFANSMDLTSLTSPTVNIPLSKHVHNHSIGCTAINSVGMTNTSIRLLIRYPPTFIVRPPKFVVVDLNSKSSLKPTILRCIVDSYPRAKITWHRYGEIIAKGLSFNLENITKREQQGIYSYRIETEGFETIKSDFIIYMKGKPLIYIQESKQYNRLFECQVYSSSPILRISWRLNDQPIASSDQLSISTTCGDYSCISKLVYDYPRIIPSSKILNRLSCIGENEFGIDQSRLYQMNTSDDPTIILLSIILSTFILIVFFSAVAIYCCCRVRRIRKRHKCLNNKKLPVVYDEHYSINELIKEVGSLRTCNTSMNNADKLSLQMDSTDHLLTTSLNNHNTKTVLDNLSNESSTNSSGFHSKSTTTIFNNEYSPRLPETVDVKFSGIYPLYTYHIK
ncbi:unnamed protein product [Rotaria socialis]|uniref:Ig-like domain-containing protein n=1 Tax=Rotaria socialis TaxID=392032 RepID=A0A818PYJ3_9BILA|nr:unnamed protein product [Rotaria socialis]CAF4515373.1 unnamed protein product [Rotaria socialis]